MLLTQARGEVIASVSTISSVEDFIVPSRELERRLLELSLAQVLADIEKSGETGVKETMSASQVIKLVDDFIFTSGECWLLRYIGCKPVPFMWLVEKSSCCIISKARCQCKYNLATTLRLSLFLGF